MVYKFKFLKICIMQYLKNNFYAFYIKALSQTSTEFPQMLKVKKNIH
jgi:hypothetical protein